MAIYKFVVGSTTSAGFHGAFFKIPAFPTTDTCVHEIHAAGQGYSRYVLKANGQLHFQYLIKGLSGDLDVSGVGTTCPLFTWLWCSACFATQGTGHDRGIYSTTLGSNFVTLGSLGSAPTLQASFNIGRSSASATLTPFPNSLGWAISKACINGSGYNGAPGTPTADWGSAGNPITIVSGFGAYFNCRGALGALTVLPDDSGGGNPLSGAGTRVLEGPFAT